MLPLPATPAPLATAAFAAPPAVSAAPPAVSATPPAVSATPPAVSATPPAAPLVAEVSTVLTGQYYCIVIVDSNSI